MKKIFKIINSDRVILFISALNLITLFINLYKFKKKKNIAHLAGMLISVLSIMTNAKRLIEIINDKIKKA